MKLRSIRDDKRMNAEDRAVYARMVFEAELHELAIVEFVSEADLDQSDPHRPYGLMAPTLEAPEEKWRLKIAIDLLLKHVADRDDEEVNQWISYWCNHFYFHIIVTDWAEELGDNDLPMDEVESRVESAFEEQNPILYAFGVSLKG